MSLAVCCCWLLGNTITDAGSVYALHCGPAFVMRSCGCVYRENGEVQRWNRTTLVLGDILTKLYVTAGHSNHGDQEVCWCSQSLWMKCRPWASSWSLHVSVRASILLLCLRAMVTICMAHLGSVTSLFKHKLHPRAGITNLQAWTRFL